MAMPGRPMPGRLTPIRQASVAVVATAVLTLDTEGAGFTDITAEVQHFVTAAGAVEGTLLLFIRHTSASLVIQENADPDVRTDLVAALDRLAPTDAGWVHEVEGPDDMPAHVKTMLTVVALAVPVMAGRLALGAWQGVYLAEHRSRPHRREVVLQFLGSRP